ncbi:hypothetical protein [Aestuariivivens sp. NBU2969]|uniref:hypothetical protein n=1 Tax=Aestuariivivens sp. NBU2969 TaxID=2873267 RepID=UPI001CBB8EA5|nr:hypothetical protein [Aestuariivivens sp. NBU2969]
METNNTTSRKKKHADFQDVYRRSSNFMSYSKKDYNAFKVKGNGYLKLKKEEHNIGLDND